MSDLLEQTTPGWRRDPSGRYEWRWWDGNAWTNRVANSATSTTAAPAPESSPSPQVPTAAAAAAVAAVPQGPSGPSSPPASFVGAAPADAPSAAPAVPHPGPVFSEPVADPFAALRAPRNSTPMQVSEHEPVPLGAEQLSAAQSPSDVRTTPSAHDGTTGTKWDGPFVPEASPSITVPERRSAGPVRRVVAAVGAFFRSFRDQEESYHSPNAGPEMPPHPKEQSLQPPPNYGRAGLVMLAALGVAVGAYLPWITYRIDDITGQRTGQDLGAALGFVLAALAFSIAAVLGARHRVMGWVTMGAALVVAAMVAIRLIDVHDQVVQLNQGPTVTAEVGTGLWVMLAASAIGLVAAFRLDTPAEIV